MADALETLVDNALRLVESGYYDQLGSGPQPPHRSMSKAIALHTTFPIIAEVKLSSPNKKGISNHGPDRLIHAYKDGGAAAISVLTEPNHFDGSLGILRSASECGLPVLMKDVVVDERQLLAAYRNGASAVLLIESVFSSNLIRKNRESLLNKAHSLGLESLLEITDEKELESAMKSKADLIGINQRNLRTMSLDMGKGERLLRMEPRSKKPIVVMSGIFSRGQVESLKNAGAASVLIGSSLSASIDPMAKLRSLEVVR
jgi:indole-3-glycerol phosphate synthase